MNVQQFDMGYFGPNHEKYGIVLFIDDAHQELTVLDISNPHKKDQVNIGLEEFVTVRNICDMANKIEQKIKDNQASTTVGFGNVIKHVKVVTKLNYSDLLLKAKQTFSYAVQHANHNYREQRESILTSLINIAAYDRECMQELDEIIKSRFDYNHRIVTIKPSKGNQIFHLTLSIIGNDVIIHDASVRYDNCAIFKNTYTLSAISANSTSDAVMGVA